AVTIERLSLSIPSHTGKEVKWQGKAICPFGSSRRFFEKARADSETWDFGLVMNEGKLFELSPPAAYLVSARNASLHLLASFQLRMPNAYYLVLEANRHKLTLQGLASQHGCKHSARRPGQEPRSPLGFSEKSGRRHSKGRPLSHRHSGGKTDDYTALYQVMSDSGSSRRLWAKGRKPDEAYATREGAFSHLTLRRGGFKFLGRAVRDSKERSSFSNSPVE
ncbi:hypothetical protein HAX54_004094, partial [Datura stramonium]|nr:hypothetical protein [Datura stramonium]